MAKKIINPPKGESQIQRFREAARELGCDESEEAFDEALKRVGKAPLPKSDQKKRKTGERD